MTTNFKLAIIIIISFIFFSFTVQFIIRTPTINIGPQYSSYTAMISSDWYIEPWFSKDGAEKNNWNIQQIDKFSDSTKLNCGKVGESQQGDTPIGIIKSAIDKFCTDVPNISNRLFFFLGDVFSHNLYKLNKDIESSVMDDITYNLIQHFDKDKIFLTVGNHGGKTNQAFWTQDEISNSWSSSLIKSGIFDINSHTQEEIDFFMKCGYYTKPIPSSNTIVICLNSIVMNNLSTHKGCDNCDCIQEQIEQLEDDLSLIESENKYAYILTHYPIDMTKPRENCQNGKCAKNYIWSVIGKKYQSTIRGILTSHLHMPVQKLNNWSTGVTWNIPSIYWAWNPKMSGQISSFISTPFPLNKQLQLSETDVYKTQCKDKQISELKWKK
jgi:hypothetical protein